MPCRQKLSRVSDRLLQAAGSRLSKGLSSTSILAPVRTAWAISSFRLSPVLSWL